jgi:AhpD family alkylhydroperoxidase
MTVKSTDQSHPATEREFKRRYYDRWSNFWGDLRFIFSNRAQIKAAMSSPKVDPAFRERLMLAVTEVNLCRYCRTFHVGQAKEAGISIDEITEYLKGNIPENVPEEQKLAVCYAQHWAESDANPDPDYIEQVREAYGEDGAQAINMVLRMIRMGNLLGNTWDYFLFKISFGSWGQ